MARNTPNSPEILVDTNIVFSAIFYPHGNERKVFANSEMNNVQVTILDYVEDEIKGIFAKKGLDYGNVVDFLDTYSSIAFREIGVISDEEASCAKRLVVDVKDRPIFVFMLRSVTEKRNCYLITGDKGLHTEPVKKALRGRVLHSTDYLKRIKRLL